MSLLTNNPTSGRSQTTAIAGLCYFTISHEERSCFYDYHSSSSCIKNISYGPFVLHFSSITLSRKHRQVLPFVRLLSYTVMYVRVAKHALAPQFFFQFCGLALVEIDVQKRAQSIFVTISASCEQQEDPGIASFPFSDLRKGKWAVKFRSSP